MTRSQGTGLFSRNNFWIGLAVGICLPVMAYGVLLTLSDFVDESLLSADVSISRGFRERTLSLIAICCNLLPFHLFNRRYADQSMRGMILPTVLYVGVWFWMFGRHLIGL